MNISRTHVLTGRMLATKLKRKSKKRTANSSEKAAHETDKTHRRSNEARRPLLLPTTTYPGSLHPTRSPLTAPHIPKQLNRVRPMSGVVVVGVSVDLEISRYDCRNNGAQFLRSSVLSITVLSHF